MAEYASLDSIIHCPAATKIWILHLGYLVADEGWFKRGANTSSTSEPNPVNQRRKGVFYSVLIEHPKEGLILWECGPGDDFPTVVGAPTNDIFAQVDHDPGQDLANAVAKTGHGIGDIKMVIMGHLHMDHAGGLLLFRNTGVPVYVHELELKHAFFSVANKSDLGVYMPHYLTFDINWKSFSGHYLEIAQGLSLRHTPGHTPGQCILQVNMLETGTWLFTSDMYHMYENYDSGVPQGWLARDHDAWVRSHEMIQLLVKRTTAKVVFGHCLDTLKRYKWAPESYQ